MCGQYDDPTTYDEEISMASGERFLDEPAGRARQDQDPNTWQAGADWAHWPALGTTCRTGLDGVVTADACGSCGRPLTLDPTDPDRATQWHLSETGAR